jgi:hypothetical protein
VNFTFNQVKYVLYRYNTFREGTWPDPKPSEKLCSKARFLRAGFEGACEVAAEIAIRVRRCGLDGMLVEAVFMREDSPRRESEIARQYHLEVWDVHRRINRVCAYCEGENARAEDYQTWLRKNRQTRKVNPVRKLLHL